jgi:hypothetical protein
MTDEVLTMAAVHDPIGELRTHAEMLERQLAEVQQRTEAQLIRAELKAEAVRAGMIDLDGLKLADLSEVKFGPSGDVEGVHALMARLKKLKPWLFGAATLSSTTTPPPAQMSRQKLASEMTDAEYRVAREALLRSRR